MPGDIHWRQTAATAQLRTARRRAVLRWPTDEIVVLQFQVGPVPVSWAKSRSRASESGCRCGNTPIAQAAGTGTVSRQHRSAGSDSGGASVDSAMLSPTVRLRLAPSQRKPAVPACLRL